MVSAILCSSILAASQLPHVKKHFQEGWQYHINLIILYDSVLEKKAQKNYTSKPIPTPFFNAHSLIAELRRK